MSKKANSNIYLFQNYIQIQKLKCFKNRLQQWSPNPQGRKNQDTPCDQNKMRH